MYLILAKWTNGEVEEVDTADTKKEADFLIQEYYMAYGSAVKKMWSKKIQKEG